jgi:RNA polymerase sigma factor (sigma-70 family)
MFLNNKNPQVAFHEFYDQTHGKAYRFAVKHSGNESIAEEIVQTAYLKIWEKQDTIRPEFITFKSYLYSTIQNLIFKEYQRKITEQTAIINFQLYESQTTENDNMDELLIKVNQAVETLPKRQQEVFRLVKMKGLSYRQVAQQLEISESTVEKHIISSLKRLRSLLSDFAFTILL